MRIHSLSLALLALGLALPAVRGADKVTLDDLLKQMADLSRLAEYPDPPYVTRQFSSYDRASHAPGDDSWFANADRGFMFYDGVVNDNTPYFTDNPTRTPPAAGTFAAGTKVGFAPTHKPVGDYVWCYATSATGGAIDGKIPQGYIPRRAVTLDPQGHVLAEMDGPGCVVNVWSANPNDGGNIRIYLDEAKEPVIEAPLTDLLGGKWKTTIDGKEATPFPDPIACERSRGYNLYFPIAYAKHCKITVDKPDIYYHVDYRAYPKGTEVETFTPGLLAEKAKDIAGVADQLAKGAVVRLEDYPSLVRTIKPGERWKACDFVGPSAVTHVIVQKAVDAAALRGLVLIATFDKAEAPQIWCPLGDFFGSAPGVNPYRSLPFRVTQNKEETEMVARWLMPFEKSATFELLNMGTEPVFVQMVISAGPYQWTDRSMHFHAKWRTEELKTRPFRDWTYCDLKGKGVFVGDVLSVMNPTAAWWGEGDEKIFVDGEKFPSWFGTGSEDYYGYAWSDPKPFSHAYHNQTRCDAKDSGGSFGHTSVNRFHVLDAIPFEKSFHFDMEVWHWTPNSTVNYAATAYWYARPGATDDFEPADAKVLQHIPSPPPPFKIAGALEGESLKILGKSSDFPLGPQPLQEFGDGQWSGGAQLWARPPKVGEYADLALPVPADGKYQVVVYMTKARDYGIVQFSVNGKPLGRPIDGFEPEKVLATGPMDLGAVELKKGQAVLRVAVVGTNDKSVGLRTMWGLDCVVLKPTAP